MTTSFLELNRVNVFSFALRRVVRKAAAALRVSRRRRKGNRTMRGFGTLTDHELLDIGLDRTEIVAIAGGVDIERTRRSRRHQ